MLKEEAQHGELMRCKECRNAMTLTPQAFTYPPIHPPIHTQLATYTHPHTPGSQAAFCGRQCSLGSAGGPAALRAAAALPPFCGEHGG